MGNYAAVSNVQELIPETISGSSTPTSTVVDGWIDLYEAKLDAALKDCGYTVPITGSTDILILRDLVMQGVAERVWNRMFTDVEKPDFVEQWRLVFENALKDACSIKLYDQDTEVDERGVSYIQVFDNDD